jgi:hypothetical protein
MIQMIDKNNSLQHEHKNNHILTSDDEIDETIRYYKPIDSFIFYSYNESDFIKTILPQKIVYTPSSLNNFNIDKIYRKEGNKNRD